MTAIKADMGERSVLLGFELTFKCQQHVSLTAYNRMRATLFSTAPFLDGALLWQHAAVCLLLLFFMSLQVECADCWQSRRKYEPVESGLGEWVCQIILILYII